jgi:glyoxylase-like metal-dependent hydrolase (beta-lactamase superfamily II)
VDADSYFEVIETPGHTRCSVSYLFHPDRILFQGDTAGLLKLDGSIKPIFLSSYLQYENSIKKLMDMEVEALAFPHNRVIRGKERVKKYLQASLARTQEMKGIIRENLKKGEDIDEVAEALYRQEFSRSSFMGPKEAILINIRAMIKNVTKELPQE